LTGSRAIERPNTFFLADGFFFLAALWPAGGNATHRQWQLLHSDASSRVSGVHLDCAPSFPAIANAPVITLDGPRVVSQPLGTAYIDQGATASDPKDGQPSPAQIVVTGVSARECDYRGRLPDPANNVADSLAYRLSNWCELCASTRFVRGTNRQGHRNTSAHMGYYEHLPRRTTATIRAKTFPLIIFQHGWFNARFLDPYTVQAPPSDPGGSDLAAGNRHRPLGIPRAVYSFDRRSVVWIRLPFVVTASFTPALHRLRHQHLSSGQTRIYLAGFSQGSGDTWDF